MIRVRLVVVDSRLCRLVIKDTTLAARAAAADASNPQAADGSRRRCHTSASRTRGADHAPTVCMRLCHLQAAAPRGTVE